MGIVKSLAQHPPPCSQAARSAGRAHIGVTALNSMIEAAHPDSIRVA